MPRGDNRRGAILFRYNKNNLTYDKILGIITISNKGFP